ncbi:MAG: Uma2 family endonuclease [Phaeodactylibacter sp.]|nr:Uma2 family endonuclease [Phaeodactylibacter sp.]MCB9299198.1 Uma2 family endonuclease [Lewinellaceae bacterium]HQU57871.1 Uma2 family endonuclease [Saprospiraceae bacterium]
MAKITDLDQLDLNGIYSYADYLSWHFQERVELIKGKIFKMSPAPSRQHQRIAMELTKQIGLYLEGKICQAYFAPFDVRLFDSRKATKENEQIHTVVQPDICVICDLSKLDDRGCLGAPDWIIEILSPGNNKNELDNKFRLYEENGVQEYWLVHPSDQTVVVFDLKEGAYQLRKLYASDDAITVGVFPEFTIDLEKVFRD